MDRRWSTVGLVALALSQAACHRLFALDHVDDVNGDAASGDGGPTDGSTDDAPTWCLDEQFDMPVGPAWLPVIDPGTSLTISDSTAIVVLASSTANLSYAGLQRTTTFLGRTIEVEVVQVPEVVTGAEASLFVGVDANNHHVMFFDAGVLRFRSRHTGLYSDGPAAIYNPEQHRFWKLAHDQGTEQVTYLTSPDGKIWFTHHSTMTPLALDAVKIGVFGGTWQSVAAPGRLVIDSLRTNACVP